MKCIKTDGQRINFKISIEQNSMLKINDYIEKLIRLRLNLVQKCTLTKTKITLEGQNQFKRSQRCFGSC